MAQNYQLTLQSGPAAGTSFPLTGDLVTIGRYAGNAVVIADDQVSRIHARLTRTPQGYTVEDLGSSNGTYVNDQMVSEPLLLAVGDRVRLGASVNLLYELLPEGAPVPPPLPRLASRDTPGTSGTVYMKAVKPEDVATKETVIGKIMDIIKGKKGEDK